LTAQEVFPLRTVALALIALGALSTSVHGQAAPSAPDQSPGATLQNDPAFLKKLEADPSFAGPEKPSRQPDSTGSTTPGEARHYTPTKQLDEGTQKPR
jgi:hypothetical protein